MENRDCERRADDEHIVRSPQLRSQAAAPRDLRQRWAVAAIRRYGEGAGQ